MFDFGAFVEDERRKRVSVFAAFDGEVGCEDRVGIRITQDLEMAASPGPDLPIQLGEAGPWEEQIEAVLARKRAMKRRHRWIGLDLERGIRREGLRVLVERVDGRASVVDLLEKRERLFRR